MRLRRAGPLAAAAVLLGVLALPAREGGTLRREQAVAWTRYCTSSRARAGLPVDDVPHPVVFLLGLRRTLPERGHPPDLLVFRLLCRR